MGLKPKLFLAVAQNSLLPNEVVRLPTTVTGRPRRFDRGRGKRVSLKLSLNVNWRRGMLRSASLPPVRLRLGNLALSLLTISLI